MDTSTKLSFKLWDRQVNSPIGYWIKWNNYYLAIERGEVKLDRHTANQLWLLGKKADMPFEYCETELEKLAEYVGYTLQVINPEPGG